MDIWPVVTPSQSSRTARPSSLPVVPPRTPPEVLRYTTQAPISARRRSNSFLSTSSLPSPSSTSAALARTSTPTFSPMPPRRLALMSTTVSMRPSPLAVAVSSLLATTAACAPTLLLPTATSSSTFRSTGTLSRRARHTSLVATTLLSACPPSWLWPRRLPRRTRYDLPKVSENTG